MISFISHNSIKNIITYYCEASRVTAHSENIGYSLDMNGQLRTISRYV